MGFVWLSTPDATDYVFLLSHFFCVSVSFMFLLLQIGSMLVNRVTNLDLTWRQEIDDLSNRPSPRLELNVDDLGLRRSIEQLTFVEMKRKSPLGLLSFISNRLAILVDDPDWRSCLNYAPSSRGIPQNPSVFVGSLWRIPHDPAT